MKRFRIAIVHLALIAALTPAASRAVPTSADHIPPVPPTGLGRLFGDDVRFSLSCSVGTGTPTSVSVGIGNTYPNLSVQYVDNSGTWSAWSNLSSTDTAYDCAGACLHSTSEVRIRGCDTAACTNLTEQCTATIGVPVDGPPDLVWSGVETLAVGALGCVQTDATEVVVRLRYAGTHPGAGYPTVGGVAATERTAERATDGAAFLRTYTIPPGWSAADITAEQWSFVVDLDGSGTRQAPARVELKEHCLNRPQASVVGTGGVLAPIATGNGFAGGSELEIATGNPASRFALTGHALSHNGASATFGRVTPSAGATDTGHTWTETATGRDGLAYTAPDLALTAQALTCESDLALASWWLSDGDTVSLPLGTGWVSGPTVMTDACPGIGADPEAAGPNSQSDSEIRVNAGSETAGWPTEVRADAATGEVNDFYYWYGTGWDTANVDWIFNVERSASLACPSGQRLVGSTCEPCPTYQQCSGGSLATTNWCNAGTPPAGDRMVSHIDCVGGVDTTVSTCTESTDPDPADNACPLCPAGQREVAGVCQTCPTYQTCDGSGNLVSNTWCDPGSPPPDATIANYQQCNSGTTVTLQACLDPGDASPVDDPCPIPTCGANERLVGNVCRPCPTYDACTSTTSTTLVTRTYCGSGREPRDARTGTRWACVSGDTEIVDYCVGEGGFGSYPGNTPCAGDDCNTFYGCNRRYSSRISSLSVVEYMYCGSSPYNPDYPQIVTRRFCPMGNTVESEEYFCVGYGGSNGSDYGPDSMCDPNADCVEYEGCRWTHVEHDRSYTNLSRTFDYCGSGTVPADSYQIVRQVCHNGTTENWTFCIGERGAVEDPGNNPCDDTPINNCANYTACSAATSTGSTSLLVSRQHCGSGAMPASAQETTRRSCNGGVETTTRYCVGTGGYSSWSSVPGDSPCQTQTCVDYKSCSSSSSSSTSANLLLDRQYCGTGSAPATAYQVTRQTCSSGSTEDWTYCIGENGESSDPGNNPCSGDPVDTCTDYQACSATYSTNLSANLLVDRQYCGTGNAPADAFHVNREICDGSTTRTRRFCVGENGESSDPGDNPCQTTCQPSGTKPCVDGTTHTWSTSSCSYVTNIVGPSTKLCQPEGTTWSWDCATETWTDSETDASCPVIGNTGYVNDRWSYTDCVYQTSTSKAKPSLAACESATWTVTDAGEGDCSWVTTGAPAEPTGCPGQGQAWGSLNTNTCSYGTVAVTAPTDCAGTLRWLEDCTWYCSIDCPAAPSTPMPTSTSDGQWWEWDDDDDVCAWVEITIPEPTWSDECGTCGQVIGNPPTWCRVYESCGYRWDTTLGSWVEYYSGASYDQPFN